jgi:uncharacterized membrane protein HdeD (DUF308 family)
MYAIEHWRELTGRWGWALASGIISLVLGFLTWTGLPSTAGWALGFVVGVDMVAHGVALVGMSRPRAG